MSKTQLTDDEIQYIKDFACEIITFCKEKTKGTEHGYANGTSAILLAGGVMLANSGFPIEKAVPMAIASIAEAYGAKVREITAEMAVPKPKDLELN